MQSLITVIGFDVFGIMVQIMISSIGSMLLYRLISRRTNGSKSGLLKDLIGIAAASFIGMALPLNTFGLLPIIFVLLQAGIREYKVLPIVFSNVIFNMLISFKDPDFIWRAGGLRITSAFLIGFAAGILLRAVYREDRLFLRRLPDICNKTFSMKSTCENFANNVSILGPYVIGGVLINSLFVRFVLYDLAVGAFENEHIAVLAAFFTHFNIVNPFFLLALKIGYSILDFRILAAVLVILKPKSFIMFFCYFAFWALLLSTSIFL